MSDTFKETTSQSWGSRIMESIKGILFGLALFIAAFVVLWWNEGRAIRTAKSLEEGAANVKTVQADKVLPENDKKLVHLSSIITVHDTLKDDEFNVAVNAAKLSRVVEMYQWTEEKSEKKEKKVGGSEETVTTYNYKKIWSISNINSSEFKIQEGHVNPSQFTYNSNELTANNVDIGAFKLSESLLNQINNYEAYPISTLDTSRIKNGILNSGTVYIGSKKYSDPQIGDQRVSFKVVKPAQVSIVARQINNTFEPYIAQEGGSVELLSYGTVSSELMFSNAQSSNTFMTWLVRLGGFFMMFIGLSMVLKPLAVVGDVLPILGSIIGMGAGLVSGVISFALSLVTIAIAWIFYRPVLGICLLVLGIGGFIGIKKILGKKKV